MVTSRTHPMLLGLHATLGDDGEPLVDGEPCTSHQAVMAVRLAAPEEAAVTSSRAAWCR
jgi:hypothetical protein